MEGQDRQGARLKRLSLVPRPLQPSAFGSNHDFTSGQQSRPSDPIKSSPIESLFPINAGTEDTDIPTRRAREISSNSNDGSSTPRQQKAIRSSISYSPAPSRSSFQLDHRSAEMSRISESGVGSSSSIRSSPLLRERSSEDAADRTREAKRGETLVEQHAELLTRIAQRERRVNELKQELAQQEASLAQLKAQWTDITVKATRPPTPSTRPTPSPVNRPSHPLTSQSISLTRAPLPSGISASDTPSSTSGQTTAQRKRASTRITPMAPPSSFGDFSMSGPLSASSSTSSTFTTPSNSSSSLAIPHDQANTLSSLLPSLGPQADQWLNGDALEEGKRFWGQLVKTVSAAAGGTVPGANGDDHERDGEQRYESSSSPFDLSSLKSMLPTSIPLWSTEPAVSPPSSQPPRPANASRLRQEVKVNKD